LCLEGVKVWRFVERGEVIDGLLEGERVDSVTWGGEDDKEVCLSAGWQSEKSLFKHLNGHLNEPVPSARELSEMDVADKVALMSLIAADPTCLVPDVALPPRTSVLTAIQRPGDLLLIPRNYWHQTYVQEWRQVETRDAHHEGRSFTRKEVQSAQRTAQNARKAAKSALPAA